MRVAIDSRPLFWGQSGISRNLLQTVRYLIRARPDWEIHLLFNRTADARQAEQFDGLQGRNVAIECLEAATPIYEYAALPMWRCMNRPDVFVSSTPETFPLWIGPTMVYVYDLIPELFPQLLPYRHRILAKAGMYRAVARMADQIVTLSDNTKRDLERHYQISSQKIRVVPGLLDDRFRVMSAPEAEAQVERLLGGSYRVVLAMNTVRMSEFIRSISLFLDESDSAIRVVLVGKPKAWPEFRELLSDRARSQFVLLERVTDYELVCLYNQADCFVFPSYYEGFGYPPVEAMACGTAVVTYSGSSLDEVVGQAALKVSPGDVAGLASAISRVLADEAFRCQLERAGLERAQLFGAGVLGQEVIKSLEATREGIPGVKRGSLEHV